MIPKQPACELQLKPFGWTGREAEWIALVCRHSGLFTLSQFCRYLHARPQRARQFVRCLRDRRQAVEENLIATVGKADDTRTLGSPSRDSGKGRMRVSEVS